MAADCRPAGALAAGAPSLVVVLALAAIEAPIATGARPAQLMVQVGVARSSATVTALGSARVAEIDRDALREARRAD